MQSDVCSICLFLILLFDGALKCSAVPVFVPSAAARFDSYPVISRELICCSQPLELRLTLGQKRT